MKGQSFGRRLRHAVAGLAHAVRHEASMRTHIVVAGTVLLVLIVVRPQPVWWALVVLTIGLVFVAELVNTALEALLDHLHPDRHPAVGAAKDVAAAAVLVASSVSVVIGVLLLIDWLCD